MDCDLETAFPTALLVHDGLQATTLRQLAPETNLRVVAFVDRTADVQQAAHTLLSARTSFGTRSAYAPDLILVNAFVHENFLKHVEAFLTESKSEYRDKIRVEVRKLTGLAKNRVEKSSASVHMCPDAANDIAQRPKTAREALDNDQEPGLLNISPMTSIDDGIDFLSTGLRQPYQALYIFSDAKSANYISQHLSAEATFVNRMPEALLLGPPAPFSPSQPISIHHRYTPVMFTEARPAWTANAKRREHTEPVCSLQQALAPLPPNGRPLYEVSVGFFEQGIFIGLGMFGVPILVTLGVGVVPGVKYLLLR
ncbi:hypothetical protein BAUCODRAFT_149457 [Baudoinia panamericana UAMH 10762]|uniref:Aldehyde dehydrogenase domain-containing protein n=1 Tax=Baudoinia panamericana (strain UAMH 10762) TaxID=717646 RepID=M2MFV5_BAUPA|nr:uncharacterized protein BAUCODRAFT_149457 [Baudoinia panamericana UAMH 10762]EMC95496.1 hypothetical protein BAUCODRAFT_149457 [Baudoinia panamericana UAMH 10762]